MRSSPPFNPQSRKEAPPVPPLVDTSVLSLLPRIDDDLAAKTREPGCPHCGGRLDVADYPRAPRGMAEELDASWDSRRSFCCAVEGCRRRSALPSVRRASRLSAYRLRAFQWSS